MRKPHREGGRILLSSPPTTAPRVPCSMFFSAPGDGGAEWKSVIPDVTSVKSELKSEPGSDPAPLGFWNARLVLGRDHGDARREANLA